MRLHANLAKALWFVLASVWPLVAHGPLSQRIAHTDPAQYHTAKAVHGGAGQMEFMVLLDAQSLDTNLLFLHRGVLEPKGGIGHHFHNQCEEMFVIFDGEAQFTIDGRTSVLKAPAGANLPDGPFARDLQRHGQARPMDEHQRVGGKRRVRRVQPR